MMPDNKPLGIRHMFAVWEPSTFEPKTPKQLLRHMGIKKVIFNERATIVYLTTGEKGVAMRSLDDEYDPVVGICVAYAMAEGTKGNKKQFKKLMHKLYEKETK